MKILVNIDVPDLKSAERFYTSAFDLKIGRRFGDSGVELLGFPSEIYLLQKAAGSSPTPLSTDKRNYERHWTPVHLDVVVDSIETAVEKARKAGANIESDIKVSNWGKIAYASDPFGNGFCLVEFVGRGYDEIADN